MPVVGGPKERVARDGKTFDHHHVLIRFGRHCVVKGPENSAGGGIHRDGFAVLYRVENAIDHQRSSFHLVEILRTPDPLQLQVFHVVAVELRQHAVAHAGVASAVGEPVLGLALSVEDAVVGYLCRQSGGYKSQRQ